jgi:hypothetical protein
MKSTARIRVADGTETRVLFIEDNGNLATEFFIALLNYFVCLIYP